MAAAEHYVKLMLGDLILRNALLQEQVDQLQEVQEWARRKGWKPPEPAAPAPAAAQPASEPPGRPNRRRKAPESPRDGSTQA
jgi:hypothetical protein